MISIAIHQPHRVLFLNGIFLLIILMPNTVIEPTSWGDYLANKDGIRIEANMVSVKHLTIWCRNHRTWDSGHGVMLF